MKKNAVIFDLDGTLVNTLTDLANTGNEVLYRLGLPPHSEEAYKLFVGNGIRTLIKRILPENSEESLIDECLDSFNVVYQHEWQKNGCLYDGVSEMVELLSAGGYPLAVLSNKPHTFTCRFIDYFFPAHPFSLVYGQQEGIPKKPDPAMVFQILNKLGCAPEQSFFLGDSGVDMKTGKRSGMITAGASWGFRDETELLGNGADKIVNTPIEFVAYVKSFS